MDRRPAGRFGTGIRRGLRGGAGAVGAAAGGGAGRIARARRGRRARVAGIQPALHPEPYVFVTVPEPPPDLEPFAFIREDEGITLVVTRGQADQAACRTSTWPPASP